MKNINPISTQAWQKLYQLAVENKELLLKTCLKTVLDSKFSIQLEDILVDYSKNRVDEETKSAFDSIGEKKLS
jgi:glucose-6-phosphate isomerase